MIEIPRNIKTGLLVKALHCCILKKVSPVSGCPSIEQTAPLQFYVAIFVKEKFSQSQMLNFLVSKHALTFLLSRQKLKGPARVEISFWWWWEIRLELLGKRVLFWGELMRIWFWFNCFGVGFRGKLSHEVLLIDFAIIFGIL